MSEHGWSAVDAELEHRLGAALWIDAEQVGRRPGPGVAWDVELKAQPATWRVAARAEDGWLVLEASSSCEIAGSAVDWLACNDGLAGGVKLALAAGENNPHLRAEIPLEQPESHVLTSLIPKLSAVYRGFAKAFTRTSAARAREHFALATAFADESNRASLRPEGEASTALAQRLGELGWPHSPRSDGSYNVDLEVGAGFAQANVAQSPDSGVELRVALPEAAKDCCREAVATLLVRCCAWVRLVRAASDAEGRTRLEVVLPSAAGDDELSHALCALSLAMRVTGDEVALLSRDEALASLMLSLADQETGVRSGRCPTNDNE